MKNSLLWLLGAGITVIQLVIGNVIVFYGVLPALIGAHALLAAILLVIAILGYARVKLPIEKRILIGNIVLVVIVGILGYLYFSLASPILVIIHFLLALGVLANFSVLYGFDVGQRYK
ncbi:hypothetical protein BFU36_08055 [Sulfolobus sp. A20]|uniref:hypothetical protein n=1 Tax=Saccharolobus sp. A20 TaxID=1891280 RepID=UPI0008460D62|nr:hypothetical protein [Sulfolobus sp. A20]TRM74562.1 hypothetical protein DJ528_10260 [Sulfolobus sp. B5]TRM74903.1 hypothetical protein DJ532_11580 [Sulfolobus sp. A20-N-F8]TRM80999.1 hypothetical protein DJ531_11510 [Sulfolobus sp. A20-N-F6]TRM83564.1 hypothetical protein DJ522_06090 [Sulfolobus sp. F3]TRM86287.1 hypothetical protein DJ529_11660 [Sulfolobus sp. C3]TRM91910.1 hypothetical protein DJ526_06500 [Sulfolobus sp. A20-N-G8]TRM98118.1 hypothetical protein DJ527_11285 [Sulfolobus 